MRKDTGNLEFERDTAGNPIPNPLIHSGRTISRAEMDAINRGHLSIDPSHSMTKKTNLSALIELMRIFAEAAAAAGIDGQLLLTGPASTGKTGTATRRALHEVLDRISNDTVMDSHGVPMTVPPTFTIHLSDEPSQMAKAPDGGGESLGDAMIRRLRAEMEKAAAYSPPPHLGLEDLSPTGRAFLRRLEAFSNPAPVNRKQRPGGSEP
jgi:hypothetical protein